MLQNAGSQHFSRMGNGIVRTKFDCPYILHCFDMYWRSPLNRHVCIEEMQGIFHCMQSVSRQLVDGNWLMDNWSMIQFLACTATSSEHTRESIWQKFSETAAKGPTWTRLVISVLGNCQRDCVFLEVKHHNKSEKPIMRFPSCNQQHQESFKLRSYKLEPVFI